MGLCQSLQYEDEDEIKIRNMHKEHAKKLKKLQKELKKQRQQFSELDLTGKPKVKTPVVSSIVSRESITEINEL